MPFVSRFLLPLVKGGPLHVGRPLGAAAVERLRARGAGDADAAAELERHRHARARALLDGIAPPPLDEATLRLGVAVHNLLALSHPALCGRGEARQRRIAEVTEPIADLGPPRSAEEAVRRHSVVARLPEITRTEHTVDLWLGQRHFVGRPPPARLLALPRLRRVATTSSRRLWWKEIGVPAFAQGPWVALHRASPLGEALDPLRLDPPLAWERVFPVLRFPPICRLVAGRLVEIGLEAGGGALFEALLRFSALRDVRGAPTGPALAFAIRFLAHACWLGQLYGGGGDLGAGSDMAALLGAADEVEPALVWPSDVPQDSDVGRRFGERLSQLRGRTRLRFPERYAVALGLCRLAKSPARDDARSA